jgi:hypothetical protein
VGCNREVGWTFRRLNPGGGKIFPTRPDGRTNFLYNGGNAAQRLEYGVKHPIPSNEEVKETVELYFYTHFGPSWLVTGWTVPFTSSPHFGTRHVRERKENNLLKLLHFGAFTIVSYCKENKRLGIKSEKLRRQPALPLDLSNEHRCTGASSHFVSRIENVQFPIHCGLLDAAC